MTAPRKTGAPVEALRLAVALVTAWNDSLYAMADVGFNDGLERLATCIAANRREIDKFIGDAT